MAKDNTQEKKPIEESIVNLLEMLAKSQNNDTKNNILFAYEGIIHTTILKNNHDAIKSAYSKAACGVIPKNHRRFKDVMKHLDEGKKEASKI